MMIGKRPRKGELEEKVLDVDASIQGNVIFNDPVNLKINGKFDGSLTTKGNLTIGEGAEISADIVGEHIAIAGRVTGDIIAEKTLKLASPARLIGNVKTPSLAIEEGAVLNGNCQMVFDEAEVNRLRSQRKNALNIDEVARYLEVDAAAVAEWANSGRLQGRKENGAWRFDRAVVDEWIKSEKVK